MSCWVVPTIAAELWGVSIDHVLDCVRNGQLASRREAGFTFVDIAPDVAINKPPTYTIITPEEFAALAGHAPEDVAEDVSDDVDVEIVDAESGAEAESGKLDWRQARVEASRMRIAPRRMAG